ncbi:DinB family protein [Chitinophaga agrisoli]|uniref:DinB family protein n=1 Tax=Chitinophaga agrisoli TaxID=2607653 RepID=A0A5B2VMU9_9BACT|nr:DinB family protein [Chitinophaga agrisoli]KAA2239469.1 DinB family protein [Chitinophaga agrisoli]
MSLVDTTSLEATAAGLEQTLAAALPQLRNISAAEAEMRPAPGKWSKKEILGHLVDSALNNHQRFVRAQRGPLELPGYEQDFWVQAQGYQQMDWQALIYLWETVNRHVVHVIRRIPAEMLPQVCKIGANAPVTLEYLVADYLDHMHHHLHQLQIEI